MWLTNLPNFLTILRISLIPILIVAFYWPSEWRHVAATSIFALAAFTDWLDGYLARKLKQSSSVGAFLDPVADKLVVVVALVLLVESYSNTLMSISAVIIVCREIIVSALREWMAGIGKSSKVAVSWIGKVKTFTQMSAITLFLSQPAMTLQASVSSNMVTLVGYISLIIAVVLTIWSMCQYSYVAWRDVRTVN